MKDNKLIAEFMYPNRDKRKKSFSFPFPIFEYYPSEKIMGYGYVDEYNERITSGTPDMMLYHKSWDWLMSVVKKITKILKNPRGQYEIQWRMFYDYQSYNFFEGNITPIYEAVIKFIKWYNEKN